MTFGFLRKVYILMIEKMQPGVLVLEILEILNITSYLKYLVAASISCGGITEAFPAGSCMFKVNIRNARAKCEICSKLTIKDNGIVLVSLLLTLNIYHTLF